VATRALARDTVLAPADVRLAPLPSGALGSGVLFDVEGAVGRRLRRPVDAGQVLTINQLMAATVVRRGQQVMLEAEAPGYVVRMAGVAQRDGALGDIIEVQNVNSGRTVQAVVRSAKSVQVLLQ
jgi:flagella basal body P-ring formation protein FlgA